MRFRFWLHVGVGAVVGAGVGVAVIVGTAPVYSATASVLVESVGTEVNMQTEAQLVRSTQTAVDANARLSDRASQLIDLGHVVDVAAVPGTSVLVIRYEAGTAEGARAGAMAFAEAYLAGRGGAARTSIGEQISSLLLRLDEVNGQPVRSTRAHAGHRLSPPLSDDAGHPPHRRPI
jgi:uncharacterized protein involved in exopolysaccharide biosynthesis